MSIMDYAMASEWAEELNPNVSKSQSRRVSIQLQGVTDNPLLSANEILAMITKKIERGLEVLNGHLIINLDVLGSKGFVTFTQSDLDSKLVTKDQFDVHHQSFVDAIESKGYRVNRFTKDGENALQIYCK